MLNMLILRNKTTERKSRHLPESNCCTQLKCFTANSTQLSNHHYGTDGQIASFNVNILIAFRHF